LAATASSLDDRLGDQRDVVEHRAQAILGVLGGVRDVQEAVAESAHRGAGLLGGVVRPLDRHLGGADLVREAVPGAGVLLGVGGAGVDDRVLLGEVVGDLPDGRGADLHVGPHLPHLHLEPVHRVEVVVRPRRTLGDQRRHLGLEDLVQLDIRLPLGADALKGVDLVLGRARGAAVGHSLGVDGGFLLRLAHDLGVPLLGLAHLGVVLGLGLGPRLGLAPLGGLGGGGLLRQEDVDLVARLRDVGGVLLDGGAAASGGLLLLRQPPLLVVGHRGVDAIHEVQPFALLPAVPGFHLPELRPHLGEVAPGLGLLADQLRHEALVGLMLVELLDRRAGRLAPQRRGLGLVAGRLGIHLPEMLTEPG
jgi:hypothetical protein